MLRDLLNCAALAGLTSYFVYAALSVSGLRTKLRDLLSRSGARLAAKAVDCDFCLIWWLNLSVSLVFAAVYGPGCVLCAPAAAVVGVTLNRTL